MCIVCPSGGETGHISNPGARAIGAGSEVWIFWEIIPIFIDALGLGLTNSLAKNWLTSFSGLTLRGPFIGSLPTVTLEKSWTLLGFLLSWPPEERF